jgi:dephospho-CoA kinase
METESESSTRGAPVTVPFVGLTGGLGSGKSTALAALERLGAATLSTDAVVHELYASGELRDAVVGRWGEEVAPGGVVDRSAVARHAFGDPHERAWLEGLVWPKVGERVIAFREQALAADPPPRAAVVETPLLFEAGMEGAYDATIAVVADEEVRAQRAAARGHHGVDERAARQLSQDEKAARATLRGAQRRLGRGARGQAVGGAWQAGGDVSTRAAPARTARRTSMRKRRDRRRRLVGLAVLMGVCIAVIGSLLPSADKAVQELTLPLRHEDIIRQQAADKGVDASLIAGVIYAESRFRDQTSPAGARGLMQITPQTAEEIAQRSGGTEFEQGDLGTPQINIAYGTWYLEWLLGHYGGNEMLAVAAYNAGTGNVDGWIADDPEMKREEIPFPETRAYVKTVLDVRRQYRERYARELGL